MRFLMMSVPFFDFQDETGCRISEAVSLRWHQVVFQNEIVFWEEGQTKNEEPKVHPFTSRLAELLGQQREIVSRLEKQAGKIIPFVFPRYSAARTIIGAGMVYLDKSRGREVPARYFYEQWRKALEQAKVTDRRTHDLRRGTAIRRDNAGISTDSNMKLSGWKTPAMLQRYLKGKTIDDLRSAVSLLEPEGKKVKKILTVRKRAFNRQNTNRFTIRK
jgi:integrase